MSDIIEKAKQSQKEALREGKEEKPIETSYLETPDYILEQIQIATDANDATHAQGMYLSLIHI